MNLGHCQDQNPTKLMNTSQRRRNTTKSGGPVLLLQHLPAKIWLKFSIDTYHYLTMDLALVFDVSINSSFLPSFSVRCYFGPYINKLKILCILKTVSKSLVWDLTHKLRTPNEAISSKFLTFGLKQTIWAILGYFRPIYQHPFWYCESLVHFFH